MYLTRPESNLVKPENISNSINNVAGNLNSEDASVDSKKRFANKLNGKKQQKTSSKPLRIFYLLN